jgi:hypothetical protein
MFIAHTFTTDHHLLLDLELSANQGWMYNGWKKEMNH